MNSEILIVDDDRLQVQTLSRVLKDAGYCVRGVSGGRQALSAIRERRPDLILLDVMMPLMNGYETCREIRLADSGLPIVFLTAMETDEAELEGLAAGGDLFISKCESDDILLARISALLRPRELTFEMPESDFRFGPWNVLATKQMLRAPLGRMVPISERELFLLRVFASRPGEIFSRERLVTMMRLDDQEQPDNALSVIVYGLRRKLGRTGDTIKAVRGTGYVYRD